MSSYVLGIDTGGTYTDGVIIDRRTREIVAKAKSLTTREDLSKGISSVIGMIRLSEFSPIDFAALSTTLATNAIVEGRGCEVGLILIGFNPEQVGGDLPSAVTEYVAGGHDINGREKTPLDEEGLTAALERMRGKVDALAISSYLSVRNPEHELAARDIAARTLGLPVVCAHQLTAALGLKERSVTAILNARLLPIIDELIVSVRKSLLASSKQDGGQIPIMIVKGDGSLMGESQARERPIETILSGPAASIIGANFLANTSDGMVLDMGGTTSDIAVLRGGMPKLNKEGARVGGWLTRVEAADIDTYGLGGDSHIRRDIHGAFRIGPRRVHPICVMCSKWPHLLNELSSIHLPRSKMLVSSQITDCFILLRTGDERADRALAGQELEIVNALSDGPHSVFQIAARLGTEVNMLDLDRLAATGILGHISFTPTDTLHALGSYSDWSREGAEIAADLMASRFDMSREEFLQFVVRRMDERLAHVTWQSLLNQQGTPHGLENDRLFDIFSRMILSPDENDLMSCSMIPNIPVIGIGAPVRAWLPGFAKKIGAKLILPDHAEVANAVGAAVGRVMEAVRILITPGENNLGYTLHSRWERRFFEKLPEATEYGKRFAEDKARELAEANGAKNIEVIMNCRDVSASTNGLKNDIYIETRIEAIATEPPSWGE